MVVQGDELGDEIEELLDALHEKMGSITHERTGTGVLRAVRTLAGHHLAKVTDKLQTFDFPYNKFVQDMWHTLAMDNKMNTRVLEILLNTLHTCRPYDETKDRVKVLSVRSRATMFHFVKGQL